VSADRVWIADAGNHRVRQVSQVATTPPPTANQRPPEVSPPGVTPPKVGQSMVAGRVSGRVLIRVTGTKQFVPLTVGNFPLGSELDVSGGVGAVFYATDEAGTDASAFASGGRLLARQPRAFVQGQRPGELDLSEKLSKCPSTRSLARSATRGTTAKVARSSNLAHAARRAHHAKRRKSRKLRVRAKGKIRTKGRYGSAIVRGTGWTTRDVCSGTRSGTLFSVFEGVVSVRDFVQRKTVRVPAGKRYFAGA
jgi:hypothetical protein